MILCVCVCGCLLCVRTTKLVDMIFMEHIFMNVVQNVGFIRIHLTALMCEWTDTYTINSAKHSADQFYWMELQEVLKKIWTIWKEEKNRFCGLRIHFNTTDNLVFPPKSVNRFAIKTTTTKSRERKRTQKQKQKRKREKNYRFSIFEQVLWTNVCVCVRNNNFELINSIN